MEAGRGPLRVIRRMRRVLRLTLLSAVLFLITDSVFAQDLPEFRVQRADVPPTIDGRLDDAVWQRPPLDLAEWITYNPLKGEAGGPRTEVRVAYDDRYLYFAFHCFDNDPSKIRTTISKRDTVFNDDWVGLSLDSAASAQSAYHLLVNPSGVQMDALNTQTSGEQFDADFVWDSAGAITADGFVVEIRLPLQSIRFRGGPNVRMGILFWRRVSRTGKSYSWPDLPPGQWVFNRHAHLVFDSLNPRRLVEALPSVTYPLRQTRAALDRWNIADGNMSFGVSGKLGITSSTTIEATVNPDFSQVESDSFQVQVNQRYPIFYSEKRPFFMEGMGLFNISGTGGDSNMRTAVHTRRIVDPSWGTKVVGTVGKTTFGVLSASDSTPDTGGDPDNGVVGAHKLFVISRAAQSLGGSNYIGAIATDTEQGSAFNRVAGADFSWRPTPSYQLVGMALASDTGGLSVTRHSGRAAELDSDFSTHRVTANAYIQHYDRDFQMDTAFYNRTGFTSLITYDAIDFYPRSNRFGVLHVFPFVWGEFGYDEVQRGYERTINTGVRFNFSRQGWLSASYIDGYGPWLGQRYKTAGGININGNAQVLRWLAFNAFVSRGPQIYYDQTNPFQGAAASAGGGVTLQPTAHIRQSIDYNGERFDRQSTGERVFTVHIVNTKTTYQFDRHFLIRLLEQFDSSRSQLLSDLLASYEFVPGTVFQAGYGSIYERATFDGGIATPASVGRYLTTSRGFFLKVSYLHRF